MKTFRNGPLEFCLPDGWVEETDTDGGKMYFRNGDEFSTLRVNVLSATKPNPKQDEVSNMLRERGKKYPNSQFSHLNGKPTLYRESTSVENQEELKSHFWEVDTFIPPASLWSATFSYIYPKSMEKNPQIETDVKMLWDSIKSLKIGATIV